MQQRHALRQEDSTANNKSHTWFDQTYPAIKVLTLKKHNYCSVLLFAVGLLRGSSSCLFVGECQYVDVDTTLTITITYYY